MRSVYEAFNNPGWSWLKNPPRNPHDRWPTISEVESDVVRIRPGQLILMDNMDHEDAELEDMYLRARAGF